MDGRTFLESEAVSNGSRPKTTCEGIPDINEVNTNPAQGREGAENTHADE
jgi:hypothetical protein